MTRNKEQDENMVPEIFKEMEEADNSDGFESCEDDPVQKITGNPFQDFSIDIKEVNDEDEALMIKICRKMIVDWIEAGYDNDLEGWKRHSTGGNKKNPISVYVPVKSGNLVKTRFHIPLSNCKLEDALKYIVDKDLRMKYDSDTIESVVTKK